MKRLDPNLALAAAAAFTVVVEALTRSQARYGPECLVTGLAVAFAWRERDRLAPSAVITLAVALPAFVGVVHLAKHVDGDIDVQQVYPAQGQALLDGTYPHSEYPPGAVLLFAFEQLVRSARTVNPFAMAACQGAVAWSLTRLPNGTWPAALVALWPVNAFFWEFKYDAWPTALLAVGLVLALEERWALSGAALGIGAAAKWSPAVSCLLLVLWLLRARGRRTAAVHVGSAVTAFAAVVVPFLLWSPDAVWAAVSRQAPRKITPESFWFLPFKAVGKAHQAGAVYDAAVVPHWANTAAVVVQVAVLAALAALLVLRPPAPAGAVALAGVGAVAFLLLNKVFSAQYLVTVLAVLCLVAALLGRPEIAALAAAAAVANVLVYPIGRFWLPASACLFVTALVACAITAREAFTSPRYPAGP